MKVDDAWILKNVASLTPETAKFLIVHHGMGRLNISQQTVDALKSRAYGLSGGAVPSGLDWAERAAGERE